MRLVIDRRDTRMTHYNFDKELEEKIVKTIIEDCNGLLVTINIGDFIYLYLCRVGINFDDIVMEDRDGDKYLIYVRC